MKQNKIEWHVFDISGTKIGHILKEGRGRSMIYVAYGISENYLGSYFKKNVAVDSIKDVTHSYIVAVARTR